MTEAWQYTLSLQEGLALSSYTGLLMLVALLNPLALYFFRSPFSLAFLTLEVRHAHWFFFNQSFVQIFLNSTQFWAFLTVSHLCFCDRKYTRFWQSNCYRWQAWCRLTKCTIMIETLLPESSLKGFALHPNLNLYMKGIWHCVFWDSKLPKVRGMKNHRRYDSLSKLLDVCQCIKTTLIGDNLVNEEYRESARGFVEYPEQNWIIFTSWHFFMG